MDNVVPQSRSTEYFAEIFSAFWGLGPQVSQENMLLIDIFMYCLYFQVLGVLSLDSVSHDVHGCYLAFINLEHHGK